MQKLRARSTVHKIGLSDLTPAGALRLNEFPLLNVFLTSAVIDASNGLAYFGTNVGPGIVAKIRLSDFTEVGALTLNSGENFLLSAVIDNVSGFAYFGTADGWPGIVVKVRLSDFARVGALTLYQDVAVTAVAVSRNFAYNGVPSYPINLNVTVLNLGASSGTFNVSAYFNSTQVGGASGGRSVTLASGSSMVVAFDWYTNSSLIGSYTISGHASPVPGETNLANNDLAMGGTFQVRKAGDVDGDGTVDISDLVLVWVHQFTKNLRVPTTSTTTEA